MQSSSASSRLEGGADNVILVVVGCIFAALFVALYSSVHSSDAGEYRQIYDAIAFEGVSLDSFPRAEIFYYQWNRMVGWLGVSFEMFLFISTLLFLGLKLAAFKRLSHRASLTSIFVIYVALFFLLHESIQYKISWALALATWACVFMADRRFFAAIIVMGLAAGFHITSVVLPLVFFSTRFIFKNNAFRVFLIIFGLFLWSFSSSLLEQVMNVIALVDLRYYDYIAPERLADQNSSGLYGQYVLGTGLVVFGISFKAFSSVFEDVRAQALTLYISVAILIVLSDFVSMASRLSDVLLVMLVPVMSNLLMVGRRRRSLTMLVIGGYCAGIFVARIMVNWKFFDLFPNRYG